MQPLRSGRVNRWAATGRPLALLLALCTLAAGCASPAPSASAPASSEGISLTFVSFSAGTSGHARMDAIAESVRLNHPDWSVSSMSAGGEARLIEKRVKGEADFYNTMSPRALDVLVNEPLYPEVDYVSTTDYLIVMPASSMHVHFLVLEDTGLTSIADMIGRRFPMVMGCGVGIMREVLSQIFGHYGVTLEETEAWGSRYETLMMASAEGIEALQSGRINMGMTWGALPQPAYMGVSFGVRLLPLDDPALVAHMEGLGCVATTIPTGTYPFVEADVPTVAASQYFVARPEVPDGVVYEVIKAIYEHAELLYSVHADARSLLTPEGISRAVEIAERTGEAFHPGALRFYRELGWIE